MRRWLPQLLALALLPGAARAQEVTGSLQGRVVTRTSEPVPDACVTEACFLEALALARRQQARSLELPAATRRSNQSR